MVEGVGFQRMCERLSHFEEMSLRVGLVGERLESLTDGEAAHFLSAAYQDAALRGPAAQPVFLPVALALFRPTLLSRRAELSATARQLGLHDVADCLSSSADDAEQAAQRCAPELGRGRPLTLGERKALARTHDRRLIERVVRDPHPDVIRILLNNPALTEDDVVRACAARPNSAQVLRVVFEHQRWVVRYRPRNSLVRNPRCPLDVALLLAPLLRHADLREVSSSGDLAPPLRLACKNVLAARSSNTELADP
jgi:hypothetical protein